MSINSRLRNCEKSLKGRELALLWLKTSQAEGGYLEYWKTGEFQSWVSENDEASLLYHLAFTVNGSVLMAANEWRTLASWASLLGIFLIIGTTPTTPSLSPIQFSTAGEFLGRWRQKLCAFLADVVAVQRAVDSISEGYFDGHDILFADVKEHLTASAETANSLVVAYNYFAEENGRETIDVDVVKCCPGRTVLNEWVMLSRSKALVSRGRLFDARDEVLSWFGANDSIGD